MEENTHRGRSRGRLIVSPLRVRTGSSTMDCRHMLIKMAPSVFSLVTGSDRADMRD